MGTGDSGESRSRGQWTRKQWVVVGSVVVALTVIVVGAIVIGDVSSENARVQAEASASAEAKRQADADAAAAAAQNLERAKTRAHDAAAAGESRYAESVVWGDPASRTTLRGALDALAPLLTDSAATTEALRSGARDVESAMVLVGTEELAKARAEAAAAAAADKRYDALAPKLNKGNFVVHTGRDFCAYLDESYTPKNVIELLWFDTTEQYSADAAAIEVYCPEYRAAYKRARSGFDDGDHVVGEDIKAGTYHTYGRVTDCYWERNDGAGNIIDNNFITAAHKGVEVTVYKGEGFSTQGCGLWLPVK